MNNCYPINTFFTLHITTSRLNCAHRSSAFLLSLSCIYLLCILCEKNMFSIETYFLGSSINHSSSITETVLFLLYCFVNYLLYVYHSKMKTVCSIVLQNCYKHGIEKYVILLICHLYHCNLRLIYVA